MNVKNMVEKIKNFLKWYIIDDAGKWAAIDKDVEDRIKRHVERNRLTGGSNESTT